MESQYRLPINDPKKPSSKWLVYALIDPRTGEARYVGKSTTGLKRPREHRRPNPKQRYLYNWVELLRRDRLTFEIVVLTQLPSVEKLGEAEQFWIKTLRDRGCRLTNLTLGGTGRLGLKHTKAAKKKISKKNSGTGNGMYGRHQTQEAKNRIAEASSEREWTEKSRKRISQSKKGIATRGSGWHHSETTRVELAEKMKGNKGRRGQPHSKATIEKMRLAAKARLAKKAV